IAISNPNQDVLRTLTRSGVVDLIGKEWYFVRVHDAVQVCLQKLPPPTSNSSSITVASDDKKPPSSPRLLLQRLLRNEFSKRDSGDDDSSSSSSHLEPLLSTK
ncbi:hypothetical protein M569_08942, partial [Genlisea aurea]